jgi:hypothetical protein
MGAKGDACGGGKWQVNELIEWARDDRAERQALLDFFVRVGVGRWRRNRCLLKRCRHVGR